jgi:hypothetical protein
MWVLFFSDKLPASAGVKSEQQKKRSNMEIQPSTDELTSSTPKQHMVTLDGSNLTIEDLVLLEKEQTFIEIAEHAWESIQQGRKVVDNVLQGDKKVYGINTGFGSFANVKIEE